MDAASVRDHPEGMSRTTCCAAAIPVLLLGALALLLMGCETFFPLEALDPNFYTCQVTCTPGFGIGVDVQYPTGGDVNKNPGGSIAGTEPPGATGTIEEGPGTANSETWWRVRFTADNKLNWVPEAKLVVLGAVGQQKALDACVPYEWNKSRPEFDPNVLQDVVGDCTNRVAPAFQTIHSSNLPPFTVCVGEALTNFGGVGDSSCNQDCLDPSGVCTRMGWDPDPPAPDPISTAAFRTVSTCEMAGSADLLVGGHEPKEQPGVQGVMQILGRPCPGGSCKAGIGYRFTVDDIEFDSGSIFASDPKFVDLFVVGSTEPEAIQFGPFLGCTDCSFGGVPAGAAFTNVQGRRSGSSAKAGHFRNTDPLGVAVAVNWVDKTCRLSGDVGGQATDDDGSTLDISANVSVDGHLVNQPPRPDVSATAKTVECTSPAGAIVTLDGTASTDPDNNIASYVWRRGSAIGPQVGIPSSNPVVTIQQAIGQTTYDLQVVDTLFAADHEPVTISVVDTTVPTISCNAPATITPNDAPGNQAQGISFKATATDVCSGVSEVAITSASCTRAPCKVTVAGDTITIRNSGGVGDVISWTVSASDGRANTTQKICEVTVVKQK